MALPDVNQYYNTPQIQSLESTAQGSQELAGNYQTAASLLPLKLKDAIQQKLNYNQDIIQQQNKAMSDYFAAPSEARQKYQNIWDPTAREALVSRDVANAYAPYATLTDVLGQRGQSVSDIINAATGMFGQEVQQQQNQASIAQSALDRALQMAGLQYGGAQWAYEQTHAKPTAGSSGISGLEGLLGLLGGNAGGDTTPPPTGQTEAQPNYTPAMGREMLSPLGQWYYDGTEWIPASE